MTFFSKYLNTELTLLQNLEIYLSMAVFYTPIINATLPYRYRKSSCEMK